MKALWNKVKNWMNTDNHLLWISIITLIMIGLVAMYFVGPYEAVRQISGKWWGPDFFFDKFWQFALAGIIILFAFSRLSKKWIIRTSWILGIFAFILMLVTIFNPIYIRGASRYAFIFGRGIDPYLAMLPPYIVLMSHWLSKDKANKTWTAIGTTALTLFIIFAAIHAPHIFMAQVYLLLFVIMTFKARKNIPWAFYLAIGILTAFVALTGLAIWKWPHVQYRIMHLGNYATQMSVHAITSSALVGNTSESLAALSRLPGSIDDFMFTSIIAKFGILVGLLVLALYACIAKGLTDIIRTTKDKFNKMLSTGVLGLFSIYIIMALFVAFGLLAAAAYWPFIGFGGNILLTWCILFGFVIAVNKK